MSDNESEINLYLYITNVLASKEKPFELFCQGESVFKTSDTIKSSDMVILKTPVENEEVRNDEEDDVEDQFVSIRLCIPRIGVDHTQKINITKNGKYSKIGIDEIKKTLMINQQHDPYLIEENVNVITTEDLEKLSKRIEKKDFVEEVYLHLLNLKATKETPFKIFFRTKLVYKFEKDLALDSPSLLTIKLPKASDSVNVVVESMEYPNGVEFEFDLIKYGQHIRIFRENNQLKLEQEVSPNFKYFF
jgi:hypothetical protein